MLRFVIQLRLRDLVFGAVLAFAAIGCSHGDDPVDPSPTPGADSARPKVGSWFAYDVYATDTNGARIPSTEYIDTMTVTATGTFGGKSNVVVMESSGTHVEFYYHYPANGDIEMAIASPNIWPAFTWRVFPIGSQGFSTLPAIVDGKPGNRVTHRDTIQYVGVLQFAGNGEVITASHVIETEEAVNEGAAGQARTVYTTDYLFDAGLGVMMFYRGSVSAYNASGAVIWRGEGERRSLTAYMLK